MIMKGSLEASPERPQVPYANDLGGFYVPRTAALFQGFTPGLSRPITLPTPLMEGGRHG